MGARRPGGHSAPAAFTGRRAGAWRWGIVVLYMGAIFWASAQPALPGFAAGVSDKLLHATTYAGLAFAIVWASTGGCLTRVTLRHAVGAIAASTLYGLTDEIHQAFVPPRAADPLDLLADAAGAAAAAGAMWAWSIIARGRGRHAA